MGFKQLLIKVQQAESALEAREQRAIDHWLQLRLTWKAAWTPGRIIIAGLVSGFFIGRAQPVQAAARSGQIMQLVTMLSGLFAGGSAQAAAQQAEETAETVGDATGADAAPAPSAQDVSTTATES